MLNPSQKYVNLWFTSKFYGGNHVIFIILRYLTPKKLGVCIFFVKKWKFDTW